MNSELVYEFTIIEKIDTIDIFNLLIKYFNSIHIKYLNLVFCFRDYQFKGYKASRNIIKMTTSEKFKKYLYFTEYDKSGTRIVMLTNDNNNSKNVISDIQEIINMMNKSIFFEISFQGIVWDKKIGTRTIDFLNFENRYNGRYIEVSFDSDLEAGVKDYYLQVMSDCLKIKLVETKNKLILSELEKDVFNAKDIEIRKRIDMFISRKSSYFEIRTKEKIANVYFSKILKKVINGTDYNYEGYIAGYYEIYRYDNYKNCIKILFDYDKELIQMSATLRYHYIYSDLPYTFQFPIINDYLNYNTIFEFVKFCIEMTAEFIEFLNDNMSDMFTTINNGIDLKNNMFYG